MAISHAAGRRTQGAIKPGYERVLTPEALAFVVELERSFGAERKRLLAAARRAASEARCRLEARFPARDASAIRDADWTVAPLPKDLLDRRVEITGPIDRKMVINALNSGAIGLHGRFRGRQHAELGQSDRGPDQPDATRCAATITFDDPARRAALPAQPAHRGAAGAAARLASARGACAGRRRSRCRARCSISASISSTTRRNCWRAAPALISICRRWKAISRRGCGTTSSSIARRKLGVPKGTIKATVLIETILAAFEMDEILYELRDHSAGLNCGRWDYIFSSIKKFAEDPKRVMPDRGAGDDDGAFPALLQPASHQDLPPPQRPRDGRHGGADSDPQRSRRQRSGDGEGARRQAARGGRRP